MSKQWQFPSHSPPGKLKYEGDHFPLLVSPGSGVTELTQVTTSDTGVTFGSGVSVAQFEEHLRGMVERLPEHQTRSARAITDMLGQWAGQQIRNMAVSLTLTF